MAMTEASLADEADSGFNEHKATIARLYLSERKPLDEVREIMASNHHFTASYVHHHHHHHHYHHYHLPYYLQGVWSYVGTPKHDV